MSSGQNGAEAPEIPLGLGMALAQNPAALNWFAALPEEEKKRIIQHTHEIGSRKEMRAYVEALFSS